MPVIESWESNNGGSSRSSTLTCSKPSGVTSGDLLVLIGYTDDTGNGDEFYTKTGWTKIDESGTGSSDTHIAVYWRIADGTEGSSESLMRRSGLVKLTV